MLFNVNSYVRILSRLGRHLQVVQASHRGRKVSAGPRPHQDLPTPLPDAHHRPEGHFQPAAAWCQKDCSRDKHRR